MRLGRRRRGVSATGLSSADTQGSRAPSLSELHFFFRWRGSPSRSLPTAQRRSVRYAHTSDSPVLVSHALALERPPFARPPNNAVKISEACPLKCKSLVDCSCEKSSQINKNLQWRGSPFGTSQQGHDDRRRAQVPTKPTSIARASINLQWRGYPLGPPSNAETCLLYTSPSPRD